MAGNFRVVDLVEIIYIALGVYQSCSKDTLFIILAVFMVLTIPLGLAYSLIFLMLTVLRGIYSTIIDYPNIYDQYSNEFRTSKYVCYSIISFCIYVIGWRY